MSTIVLLFVVGIICLALEIFVPGAVLGVVGGICMLIGCVLAFSRFGIPGGMTATFAALTLLGLTVYLEVVVLPKTAWGKRMAVKNPSEPKRYQSVAPGDGVVGKPAEAVTALAPTGLVLVDGARYEASSQSGFFNKGDQLLVVGMDNFRLIVTKPKSNT